VSIVVIWLLFGLAAAIVATNKGKTGCGWFALGVALGPFGLLFALITPKDEQAVEQRSLQSGDTRKCPFCAELIKREAIVCKHCRRDVPVVPTPPKYPVESRRIALEYDLSALEKADHHVIYDVAKLVSPTEALRSMTKESLLKIVKDAQAEGL